MRSNRCPEGELRELSTAPNAEVFLVSGGAGCFPGGLVILTYVEYPRVCDVCVMCRRRKRAKMFKLISDQTGSDLSFFTRCLSPSPDELTCRQTSMYADLLQKYVHTSEGSSWSSTCCGPQEVVRCNCANRTVLLYKKLFGLAS